MNGGVNFFTISFLTACAASVEREVRSKEKETEVCSREKRFFALLNICNFYFP
jgi:hypothetical protein